METWIKVSTGILMKGWVRGIGRDQSFIGDVGASSAPLFNGK